MYVLIHHHITDAREFWSRAQEMLPELPPELQLHHSLTARDGTRATCLWEADSVEAVRDFLEPLMGDISRNEYAEAENREGIELPSQIVQVAHHAEVIMGDQPPAE